MSWLPKSYKEPSIGKDFLSPSKIEEGHPVKIRVLGHFDHPETAVYGWSTWESTKDKNVCHRVECTDEARAQLISKGYDKPQIFWALLVYNWEEMRPQVFEFTQATIRKKLKEIFEEESLGSPLTYDIKIGKTGAGKNTEYTVLALPQLPLPDEVAEQISASKCNVANLFTGEEVFGATVTTLRKPRPEQEA